MFSSKTYLTSSPASNAFIIAKLSALKSNVYYFFGEEPITDD